jgi:serine acetyltransferase
MGSVVVKDITKSGTYIGVPSKEMKYAQKWNSPHNRIYTNNRQTW